MQLGRGRCRDPARHRLNLGDRKEALAAARSLLARFRGNSGLRWAADLGRELMILGYPGDEAGPAALRALDERVRELEAEVAELATRQPVDAELGRVIPAAP